MASVRFDLGALFSAVDAERQRQGLTWAGLAQLVGVSASTIRRFGHADDAEADGVLALIRWLDVAPEHFVTGSSSNAGRLPGSVAGGHVRVDMDQVTEAVGGGPAPSRRRTRTTIQTLVAAARHADQPVARLTRLTDA